MEEPTLFVGYNLAVGLVVGLGLAYLAYAEASTVEYRRFLLVTLAGLALFAIGGPLAELFAPGLVHWVHGVAAVLVILGMYSPVNDDLRKEEWARLLLDEPTRVRRPADWMTPMDDAILDVFRTSDLVLTPAIVAFNIDRSREEVNRRLIRLAEHGLVEKVERGKYRMTRLGEQYLRGQLHIALLTGEAEEEEAEATERPRR